MDEIKLQVDRTLLDVVMRSTLKGLSMTGVEPIPVGASRLASQRHNISVIVGLVGASSGNIVVNVSEKGLLHLAGALLGEEQTGLTEDNIDAIMEVGNMVAGCAKEALMETDFKVEEISLPSLILGQSFAVVYARGINTVNVEFEIPGLPVSMLNDRFITVGISLLRGSGSRRR
ncbi:MAG: chemotaxis protein CheX [Polyangiales bacterium]